MTFFIVVRPGTCCVVYEAPLIVISEPVIFRSGHPSDISAIVTGVEDCL